MLISKTDLINPDRNGEGDFYSTTRVMRDEAEAGGRRRPISMATGFLSPTPCVRAENTWNIVLARTHTHTHTAPKLLASSHPHTATAEKKKKSDPFVVGCWYLCVSMETTSLFIGVIGGRDASPQEWGQNLLGAEAAISPFCDVIRRSGKWLPGERSLVPPTNLPQPITNQAWPPSLLAFARHDHQS